ncbi:MAG: NAD(+) diphosphatase [Hyphomonadaceae bacterium]|nr:NAD(+) diphosphatase [Hyphomonadaceae bacterium]MCA8885824.1 NAD(+) diphosphatase [Hyphomonadaceae bacterium]
MESDQTSLLIFNKGRPFLCEENGGLAVRWLAPHVHAQLGAREQPLLFLGLDENRAPHFACEIADAEALGELGIFEELRPAAARLPGDKLAIIGAARAVFEWHSRNRFCANCGTPSRVVEAGWVRKCDACSAEHYPRVDPVCIMVPTLADKCFLGRQKAWPRGMHSALAGFIEPGEAIEEAVARETLEEAGLKVRHVEMHSTQPWPFPHSLMIGVLCEVENDHDKVDTSELESGRWFTREEAKLLIAGKHGECWAPPPFAIAHQLLKTWSER